MMFRNISQHIVNTRFNHISELLQLVTEVAYESKCSKRCRHDFLKNVISPDAQQSLNVDDIPSVTNYQYLGIYLYLKLTWARQITYVLVKSIKAQVSLKSLLTYHSCPFE